MSIIKPFKGFRPPVNIVEKLASRPYDVLNSEEARKECEGNPYSLLHVTKAEIDLPEGTDEHSMFTLRIPYQTGCIGYTVGNTQKLHRMIKIQQLAGSSKCHHRGCKVKHFHR